MIQFGLGIVFLEGVSKKNTNTVFGCLAMFVAICPGFHQFSSGIHFPLRAEGLPKAPSLAKAVASSKPDN